MDFETMIKIVSDLGAVGIMGGVVYLLLSRTLPKMQDTFQASLDTITQRHEDSMRDVAKSLNGLREIVYTNCKAAVKKD